MAVNFPSNPTNGQTITVGGITYAYDSTQGVWSDNPQGLTQAIDALTDVDTSTSAPTNGQILQWNSTDSEWQPADSSAGVTVYATIDDLPLTGVTEGSMALVDSTDKLYIFSDTGWYSISIVNTTPSISGVNAAYTLATNGSATTITVTASDPEGIPITYSIVSDTSGNIATVSQGTGSNTNVWTITPSTNTANSGSFTLVFRASDGTNVASASSTFTLLFEIQHSNRTTALITSVGANNAVNNSFDDASTNNHTITANGNVTQGTFSPYRHGGYSTYFDGTGDFLSIPDHSDLELGTGDFSAEAWIYLAGYPISYGGYYAGGIMGKDASSGRSYSFSVTSNGSSYTGLALYMWTGGSASSITYSGTLNLGQWYHVAVTRSSGTVRLFLDGQVVATESSALNFAPSESGVDLVVGAGSSFSGYQYRFNGYISDFRFVTGSAVYTSAFTPPDERLTAVTDTALLTCHLPYIADGSTNSHSITVNGDAKTEPFSPFDHNGYSSGGNGGSMSFDGSGDYLVTGADADQFVNSNNTGTIEMWLRLDAFTSPRTTLCGHWTGSNGWTFDLDTAGSLVIATNGLVVAAVSTGLTLGRWHHFAVVNTGSAINVFTDGIYKSTQSNPSVNSASSSSLTIGSRSDNSLPTNGIIADFRFVDGTVVYDRGSASVGDKVFTPPTAPLTAITNTALLLRGTDAAIIDKSQSVETITLNGNVKSSTTQSKYLTSSMYFDGSGDYLTIPSIQLGILPFTIEMWVRLSVVTTSSNIPFLSSGTSSSVGTFQFEISSNSKLGFQYDSLSTFTTSSGLTADTWHHVAISRAGTGTNETKLFLDGVLAGSSTVASNFNSTSDIFIGRNRGNSTYASGYISDVRITKGFARYTSNFTAPTSALEG
tara:strand:+ start:511 stop:3168 length:2658 start_codon:yes stop_codon:yes gene_type:complete